MSSTYQPYREIEKDLLAYFEAGPSESSSTPACDLPPLAWAEAYRRIDDQPFSLERFKPLKEIYDDDHPRIVVIKPAQVGVSEMAITRAVHALDVGARYWKTGKSGLNVAYIFPTKEDLSPFSKERFSGLLQESDHLRELFRGAAGEDTGFDDVTFKQAGNSFLYLRGSKSESTLLSFPADFLILDEFDRMAPKAVALARKRLRASAVKRELDISTPTFPKKGIHALYLQSDQRVWEVHCEKCGVWNELDFFRDVRADGETWDVWRRWDAERLRRAVVFVACPSCRAELDRFGAGRWTARRPEVTGVRGYHVPALCFPSVSLTELAVSAVSTDPTEVTEFYRSDLGLPYEPAGSRVTEEMLKQLSHTLDNGLLSASEWRDTTMGVDVGAKYHYRITSTGADGRRYIRAMGFVSSWGGLDNLMTDFKVRHAVVDAMPELHGAEEWSARHKGKVRRAYYQDIKELFKLPAAEEKAMHGIRVRVEPELKKDTVQINRTAAMDAVYTLVATADEVWPAAVHNDPEVVAHMTAPVRVVEKDGEGQERAAWVHTKPDHLFHAAVYDRIAFLTLPKSTFVGVLPYTGEDG